MPYKPAFWYEVCHLFRDEDSDAAVRRLTSSAAISHNIYCEQPYTSPDGNRVAIIRSVDFNRDFPWCDLLVADLPSHSLMYAQRGVHCQIMNTAWGEHVFYWKPDGRLYRLSLMSLEEEDLLDAARLPPINCGMSVSPDQRYLAYGTAIPGEHKARFGVVRVDLRSGEWDMLFENPNLVNPHTQFEPRAGKTLLLQENIEPRSLPDGTVTSLGTGAHLVMIDADGSGYRRLRVGPPDTGACTGHQCFIPGTESVLLTVGTREKREGCEGNILIVEPDREARVFPTPDHELFVHVSASRCGRFFIADSYRGLRDPVALVVGCFVTGKYRTLLRDCHGTHGPQQWGHAHAYFTADNRHVIFNSEYQGHGQVYAAAVPDGFLEGLL